MVTVTVVLQHLHLVAVMDTCRSSHNEICQLVGLTESFKKHSLVYLQHFPLQLDPTSPRDPFTTAFNFQDVLVTSIIFMYILQYLHLCIRQVISCLAVIRIKPLF